MSCYHPLNAYIDGINPKTGKNILKFLPKVSDGTLLQCGIKHEDLIKIPCGKCIGCRLDYARQWADRCMLEAEYHENNWFITLTYDDDHLPPCKNESQIHSLKKSDIQDFMKKLRNKLFYKYVKEHPVASLYYDPKPKSHWRSKFKEDDPEAYREFIESQPKCKFFCSGEYGPSTMRPHYHMLLFGVPLEDLVLFRKDIERNFLYFTSDFISELWPFGYHYIAKMCWETCAYTARYIVKKQKGENAAVYEKLNYEPEFVLMSRRPGIASQWFEDHPDIVINPHYIKTEKGSKTIKSNKYFDNLFDIYYPDIIEEIKEDRIESMKERNRLKLDNTSLSYSEQLMSEETNKLAQVRSLRRKEV